MKVKVYLLEEGCRHGKSCHVFSTEKERFDFLFEECVNGFWEELESWPKIGCPVFEDENGDSVSLPETFEGFEEFTKQDAIDYFYLKCEDSFADLSERIIENPEVISE